MMYRWLWLFFLVHVLMGAGVILFYLPVPSSAIFFKIYFVMAFVAQVTVWAGICALIALIFGSILRWKGSRVICAALCGALFSGVLMGDALAYRLYHMHYAFVGWDIYKAGAFSAVLAFNFMEWVVLSIGILILLTLEMLLVLRLWKHSLRRSLGHVRLTKICLGLLSVNVLLVYTAFGVAVLEPQSFKDYRSMILHAGRIAPYLSELVLTIIPGHEHENSLHYPVKPIRYAAQIIAKEKLNLVIIGVDAWRYSAVNREVSPYLYQFAQKAIQFKQHDSAGNCTQSGLFSLFYGIPPTYWPAFLKQHRGPVLIDVLKKENYRMGIFMSAPLDFPAFDKTIFVNVDDLSTHTPGSTSIERDAHTSQHVIQFLEKQKPGKPFFAFVFYDTLHNYCENARPPDNPFHPYVQICNRFFLSKNTDPEPYLNLYKNKARYVDQQIHLVLAALEKKHLLEHTVVIITADHGEQINDRKDGLWGHASAYNTYQLHVPMIVFWPGHPPQVISYHTTHYDIVPTLMQRVLGVTNAYGDYTVGHSLFSTVRFPYYIAASYGDYAVIDLKHINRVVRFYPSGESQPTYGMHAPVLQAMHQQLQRFFN